MPFWKSLLIVTMLLFTTLILRAADIRIGLYYGTEIQSIVFSAVEGEYLISANGKPVAVVRKGSMFHIERTGSGLAVHDTAQSYGGYF
jgi:hypothetical protein